MWRRQVGWVSVLAGGLAVVVPITAIVLRAVGPEVGLAAVGFGLVAALGGAVAAAHRELDDRIRQLEARSPGTPPEAPAEPSDAADRGRTPASRVSCRSSDPGG